MISDEGSDLNRWSNASIKLSRWVPCPSFSALSRFQRRPSRLDGERSSELALVMVSRSQPLKKTVRVDIHRQAQVGGRLGQAVEPGAQVSLDVELARGLDQQAPAVSAAHHCQGSLG